MAWEKPGYSFDSEESKDLESKSKKRNLLIIFTIMGACSILLALGLGLGLGLGLSSGGVNALSLKSGDVSQECINAKQSQKKAPAGWELKIPTECSPPGQLICPSGKTDPTLLVLGLDGFRADYLLRNMTPTLDFLSRCGAYAHYMRAAFPTKTFPNHYTIATGLYPESHGIIDNYFYDPLYKEMFSYGGRNTSDNRWWGGEPIWNTAKKSGKRVATMMWPGSNVNIQDMRPDICYNYNESFSLQDRVTEVLSWFDGDPSTFPDLVMLYFEQPDSAGHQQGPFGDYVNGNLTYVDSLINQLLDGFAQRGMKDCLNLVVSADHGMEPVDCDRVVDLSKLLNTSQYTVYTGVHARMSGEYLMTQSKTASGEKKRTASRKSNPVPVDETLSQLTCNSYNNTRDWYVRFHRKQDLPRRYHYSNNRRIDEIVMDLEEDYYLADFRGSKCSVVGGNHGADNTYKSMHALFVASGPSFSQGAVLDGFENIELYNLFCEILGINASSNNGTYGILSPLTNDYMPKEDMGNVVPVFDDSERCPYPETLQERERRRNNSDCLSPTCLGSETVEHADARLNLTADAAATAVRHLLPFGMPSSNDPDICVLVQNDYVSGYSQKYQLPLWTGFIFNPVPRSAILDGHYKTDEKFENCIRADVRLSNETNCSNYFNDSIELVGTTLFPSGLANDSFTDALVSSNLVPMYKDFKNGIWKTMLHTLEEYAAKYGHLQVLLGPVFDYNADGLEDSQSDIEGFTRRNGIVPIPSHYFAIVTACNSSALALENCANYTKVLAFVLPNTQSDINCRDQLPVPEEYLRRNTARVRDVELLTGLKLFDGFSSFYRLKFLTSIAEELWPKLSWMDDANECPDLSATSCPSNYISPPLLLISLDGFRPDYLKKNLSPALERLNKCGVSTRYMKSIYPSLTFPNHHTISTGLYPESHGIIDNSMYDIALNQSFYLGSPNALNPAWWSGEPIWNTLIKNGKFAMTYFWPGSDVEIGGMRPTDYKAYNGAVPYNVRVDTALKWLNGSAGVYPNLVVLYFSKVDESGHDGGPGSLLVDEAIEAVDKAITQLMDGIYRLKLHTCINIVVVSDHGMSDMSCTNSVLLSDYLSSEVLNKSYLYTGAAGRISNKYRRSGNDYFHIPPSEQIPLYDIINPLKCQSNNMIALDKRQMNRRHHYIKNDRIDDVQLLMTDTWLVQSTSPWCPIKGMHGWDPDYESMKALFIGYGPDFLDRTTVEPFENIELYNLMAYLTNVQPAPNNGTQGSLYHLLRRQLGPSRNESLPNLNYTSCSYPEGNDEYVELANLTGTGCQCSESSSEIKKFDDRLNITGDEQQQIKSVHVAHGIPGIKDIVCVLYHADFVSGYSHQLKMPIWTSFYLSAAQVNIDTPTINCTRPDVRLFPNQQFNCLQYESAKNNGTYPVPLFPPKWSKSEKTATDTKLFSNQVPMHHDFLTDVWNLLIDYVANITLSKSSVNVVFGPIFDYDADGLQDDFTSLPKLGEIPIPSHYFVILLHCSNPNGCTDMSYDPLTFILPHWNNSRSENCQDIGPFLFENVARIRDVELLTGLQFLTTELNQESIQRRVLTPEKLWN